MTLKVFLFVFAIDKSTEAQLINVNVILKVFPPSQRNEVVINIQNSKAESGI